MTEEELSQLLQDQRDLYALKFRQERDDNEALRAENARLREALMDCESELRSVVSYIRIEGKWAYDSGILLKMLKKADAARKAMGESDG